MKLQRKGQVEIQFNWIFIIIVGGIILAFFASIALSQKKGAEQQLTADILVQFEKTITGISAVSGNAQLTELPNLDLRYDCTASCDCAAYVGDRTRATARFPMNDKIIFSPNRLKGNFILTTSSAWQYPFRVTNFFFMTSPEVKYLIEDTSYGNYLFNLLPPTTVVLNQQERPAVDKELFSPSNIPSAQGSYKVKFVFTDTDPSSFTSLSSAVQALPDADVSAVWIHTLDTNGNMEVSFYQKKAAAFVLQSSSYVLGDTTAIASIFAEDSTAYTCMMNRALKNLAFVAETYAQKSRRYLENYSNSGSLQQAPSFCSSAFGSSIYDEFSAKANIFTIQIGDETVNNGLIEDANAIKNQNNAAIQNGCPHIY